MLRRRNGLQRTPRPAPAASTATCASSRGEADPRSLIADTDAYISSLPIDDHDRRRVRITVGCNDCAAIPKVAGAGELFDGSDGAYQLMHNGVRVVPDGYCGRWMTEIIRLLHGHHEPQEELAFDRIVRELGPGSVMVELGSYWAYYSLWFLQQVPDGTVVMVEPDPANIEIGRRNFELNGRIGEFLQYSIGSTSLPPAHFECESDRVVRQIPQISVDDLMSRTGVPRIDLLLADIQGAELDMLEGAVQAIASGRLRFLVVSTHHHLISGDPLTHQRCRERIRDLGGHVLCEHSVTESFSGDGVIVASFDNRDVELPPIDMSRNHPSNSLFLEPEYYIAEAWNALRDATHALERVSSSDADAMRERMRSLGAR